MERWKWILPIVGLLIVGGGIAAFNLGQADDRTLIRKALRDSIAAGRNGQPGGVLERLSFSFKINQESPGSMFDIARFVKEQRPDVEIPEPTDDQIIVRGDTASLTTSAKVKLLMMSFDLDRVDITFRREEALAFFVIPTRAWKVAEVSAPPESLPNFGY